MADKKEETLARWRGLVADQISSGKSVAAFCREQGLREWQLYEWKKRLRGSEAAPFISVEVTSSSPVEPLAHTVRAAGIELRHCRDWSLMVEPGFDAGHLRRLLSVLEMGS